MRPEEEKESGKDVEESDKTGKLRESEEREENIDEKLRSVLDMSSLRFAVRPSHGDIQGAGSRTQSSQHE